jgi:class 3 adenylate cyclase
VERSPEIEGVLKRFLRCFASGDEAAVRALSSDEPGRRAIGTDPREWSSGEEWEAMLAQLPEIAAAGGMKVEFLETDGYEEGLIGWGAANCLAALPGGGSPLPLRITGVFRLNDGHWRAVQVHFSVGVSNEERLGMELSTPLDRIAVDVQSDRPNLRSSAAPDGTVTVLFTDIEASTELAERLGDSEWVRLVRWHRQETTESAHAHHGFVVKSLGDGFMIAFSSASDAIRCAQGVRESAAQGWAGHPIRIRAGINSGDALRDVDDFYGHAVTVAARVASLARGGEILVTHVVRELVRGGPFTFDDVRPEMLKGIDMAVEVAALVAPSGVPLAGDDRL